MLYSLNQANKPNPFCNKDYNLKTIDTLLHFKIIIKIYLSENKEVTLLV